MFKIQSIKPTCLICQYYNISTFDKNDGWCSHIKLNGRHYSVECAILGIQPDCPFKDGNIYKPEINL
jgi:hypothetical protein